MLGSKTLLTLSFSGLKLFTIADIDPTIRPFQLSNEEFARLAYAYKALSQEYPEILEYDFRAPKNKAVANAG